MFLVMIMKLSQIMSQYHMDQNFAITYKQFSFSALILMLKKKQTRCVSCLIPQAN